MVQDITLKDHTFERRIFLSRIVVASVVVFVLLSFLIARLTYLQVTEYEKWSTKSDNYRIHVQSVVPTRGLIYDRNGVLLAENIPSFNLIMVKENVENIDATIELIQSLIEFSDEDIDAFQSRLKRGRVPFSSILVRLNLSEDEIARIAVNQFRLSGISVEAQLVRFYPQGEAMAHAVGYLSSISEEELKVLDSVNYSGTHQTGKMGVEKFYENILHGQVGYQTVEKNARGQIMKVLDRTDPVPGEDIVLHLDSHLQIAAMEALGDKRGGVIALDVETGGVLAMVSKPAFDPNLFVQGISQAEYSRLNDPIDTPLFNRALAKYSPGSTVKPFIGLASLNYGVRTTEYSIHDPGYYNLLGLTKHDWTWSSGRNGHGEVNLQKAIYQSCNVYFWDLANDLGIDRMHDFMFRFGFGRNTSIDIPQASSGTLPSTQWKREAIGEPWYPGDTLNSVIGQGYTEATTLQLATATLLMANKGHWKQAAMLKKVGLEGEDIVRSVTIPDIQLENPENWDFIADAMEKVVHRGDGGYRDNGSAWANIDYVDKLDYQMAGKSGTAQVISHGEDYDYDNEEEVEEKFRNNAFFISFAPANDPKIAVVVFVEHGEAGSRVAGPIAREILDAYLLKDGELKPEFLEQDQELIQTLASSGGE
jgi:penicillin-binding protein 2